MKACANGICNRPALVAALSVAALLTVGSFIGPVSAVRCMPLRPDIRERLGKDGTRWALGAVAASGVDVPVDEFRLKLWRSGDARPTVVRMLVLLVEFSDLPAQTGKNNPRYFEQLLFSRGAGTSKTLRNYFKENSYGKLDVIGDVRGWYKMPHGSYYYSGNGAGICAECYPYNARRLVEDAIEAARADVDFSLYDNDGPDGLPSSGDDDGFVDALFVVHSGPSFEETGNPRYIVSHQWALAHPVSVGGTSVYVYAAAAEFSRVGTFCHELAHIFGLPDLYDRHYDSYALDLWSLMAAGAWLGDGRIPSHLDAWSKVKLGFVDPVSVEINAENVLLPPVERSPVVYKVWKNGRAASEYFLLENRQKTGFDSPLPAGGLLIYHVDERSGDNDNQSRYLVGLEQADGLFELDQRQPNVAYAADPGDPFPGWSVNRNFTQFSTPNSLSHDGKDVEVRVNNISVLPDFHVRCDITVETGPSFIVTGLLCDDRPGGNLDGNGDRGEVVSLYCQLKNVGKSVQNVTASASCANPYVRLTSADCSYGAIMEDETQLPLEPLIFEVDSSLARDPYRAYLIVTFTDGAYFVQKETLVVAIGDSLGLLDDFETGEGEWIHGGALGVDDWHLCTERSASGGRSWHCGLPGQSAYRPFQDSFLRSPFLVSGAGSELTFRHWLDVENETSTLAWDGCFVEVSTNNVQWLPVEPVGGYPYTMDVKGNRDVAGRGCFSGRERVWKDAVFDLSAYSGALWVRFRVVSDSASSGEGWYLDDVHVSTRHEPYTVSFGGATSSPGQVELEWIVTGRLSTYTGQGLSLLRRDDGAFGETDAFGRDPHEVTVIFEDTCRSLGLHSYLDTTVTAGKRYSYLIRDIAAGGTETLIEGPQVYVPHGALSTGFSSVTPNPMALGREALQISFAIREGSGGPVATDVRVGVFDVCGRAIRVLLEKRLFSGNHTVSWDGTDHAGNQVQSGIYFISLETGRTRGSRKIAVLK
ncbi:MAG: M6 family metalloprotease domain-containing protein [Candidatus Eisenbacteria bacterium]